MPPTYAPFNPGTDLEAAIRILTLAFGGTQEGVKDWITNKVKAADTRVMRDGPSPTTIATLVRVPMGHYFGGRSVPTIGVAGVGVAPEHRGKGIAKDLMIEALREMHKEGAALSSLYPATTTLYRRVGYEQVGCHFEHSYPASRIAPKRSQLTVTPSTDNDIPAIKDCYRRFATHCDSALDRNDYIWERVFSPRIGMANGFVIREGTQITAYIFLRQERDPIHGRHTLHISDWIATTPAAAERIVSFVGEFGSMAEEVYFGAGSAHPLFALIEEPRYLKLRFKDYWMMRLVDIAKAMTLRGYAPGLTADLHLDITDDILPENSGRWVVRVRNTETTCERGGNGDIRASARGLAALYVGMLPPHLLATQGLISGAPQPLRIAGGVFASSSTGYCDFF